MMDINEAKTYRIKPEFLDYWGSDATEETVVTMDDVEMAARGWEMNVEKVMEQLIEEE